MNAPATVHLFQLILDLTSEIGLRYKSRFNVARPYDVQPLLRTHISTPTHASYPSNHSFQSFSIACVFSRAVPEHSGNPRLFERALRVAENREWAGLHYPADTDAGRELARLVLPTLEKVLARQIQRVAAEWG